MSKTDSLERKAQKNAEQERIRLAREQHRAFRIDHERKRARRRALMSLGRRLDDALARAGILSDVSAPSLDRTHRGKPSSSPPRPINGLLYGHSDRDVRGTYEKRIRVLVEGLEHELDAHRIRPLEAELSGEIQEEVESRLIRDFEGESPSVVAFLDPAWTGVRNPEKAIKQIRLKHERDPLTGEKNA